MVYKLQFWTLVVALVAYVAKYFFPALPLTDADILAGVLFLIGLIGVYPTVRATVSAVHGITASDIFKSKAFWILVAGLVGFVVRFYAPNFPYTDAVVLSVIIFVLNQLGVNPELQYNNLTDMDEYPF